jgi:CheY-like chemotaxis protein
VKIYSEVGEGTTVKLYLPRAHATEEQDENAAPNMSLATGGETILVVEDDPDVRAYSCETLSELGYTVLFAENGREGLRMLESHPEIRLLFTDVGLPGGMNGRQLADEARKRYPKLKVLFTTGYARNAIVHNARLDPGVDLITKPFTQAALSSKLRDILDATRSPGRILVVEDEPLIQMLAIDYLEAAGFTVHTAGSAAEAMSSMRLVPGGVDAVIVDMGLPDRNGDQLVREIRATQATLPVIVATGENTADLRLKFEGEEHLKFVRKPYGARDLINALAELGIRAGGEEPLGRGIELE